MSNRDFLIRSSVGRIPSGVLSFLVNQSGIVYENDLGENTAAAAAAVTAYDPGEGWSAVTD
jgi:hypothetical protein